MAFKKYKQAIHFESIEFGELFVSPNRLRKFRKGTGGTGTLVKSAIKDDKLIGKVFGFKADYIVYVKE